MTWLRRLWKLAVCKASNQHLQVEDRFWAKVRKTDGCWLWTGTLNAKGYGVWFPKIDGEKRTRYAHRFSFELAFGYLPESVHHACEVKNCVNPTHLIPTTRSEHQSEYHVGDTCARGHALTDDNLYIVVRDDRPPYRLFSSLHVRQSRMWDRIRKERCEAHGHPARPNSKRGVCMCGWTTRVNQEIAA